MPLVAPDTACVKSPDSPAASASLTAATVTVCAVFHVPPDPPVKLSVALLPALPVVLTVTAPCKPDGTDTVTITVSPEPGSVFSLTVYDAWASSPPNSVTASAVSDTTRPGWSSSATVTATVAASE